MAQAIKFTPAEIERRREAAVHGLFADVAPDKNLE